jgi:hypothetical protein
MWRAVTRALIPSSGCWDAVNSCLTEDGSIFRRGGTANLSTAALDTSLRAIWDGILVPGARTFIASADNYGVLDGSEGVVNLGGAGTASPKRGVELGGVLFLNDSLYAGSRKTATYSAGTASFTNGSKTVTGSGTSWLANADAGMMLRRGSERVYPVASVDSDTQITLRDAYQGVTGAGAAYTLHPLFTVAAPYRTGNGGVWVVAGSRLWSLEGHFAHFSNPDDPHVFSADDNHEFTGELLGGVGLGDRLLAFTTDGVYVVSGLAFDLTDAFGNTQHRVERYTRELVLWSHEGVATWQGSAVVPCVDDLWLVDGISTPERLSKPITPLYQAYVEAGHKTGLGVVWRGHYLLPILNSSNAWVDTLVCRLDRPTESPLGVVRPFTRFNGHGAEVSGYAVRTGGSASARQPKLLGASLASTARVLNCSEYFEPDTTEEDDADGSDHEWTLDTRDYATGTGSAKSENTVRRVYVRYELESSDTATLAGFFADGTVDTSGLSKWDVAQWDVDTWAEDDAGQWQPLPEVGPEDTGRQPHCFHVAGNVATARVRFARFRFRVSAAASKMVLRAVEMKVRPTGKV